MKLLLVDDEAFTRDGIISITPWEELGIREVMTADDGREGLKKALDFHPDIILTDVRMPHMDGVDMAFQIRKTLPDCVIIFMSGYADKEYLKSAIRLSAINYIEKPFPPGELRSTLVLAVEKCLERKRLAFVTEKMTHDLTMSLPAIRNKIANELLKPLQTPGQLEEYIQIAYPGLTLEGPWITFLIHLFPAKDPLSRPSASVPDETSALSEDIPNDADEVFPVPRPAASLRDSICDLLDSRLKLSDVAGVIIGEKNENTILVHIQLMNKQMSPLPYSEIGNICYLLCDILKSTCRFLLATGAPADSFESLWESYQTASICLQRGFFHKENAVLFYEEKHNYLVYQFSEDTILPFEKALNHHDAMGASSFIRQLVEKLRRFDGTLTSSVKNFFIQAMEILYRVALLCKTNTFSEEETPETVRELIWEMSFLTDIEAYLLSRLDDFFASTDDQYTRHPLAYRIRHYVDENYDKEDLALIELATHFSISEAYLCILFKKAFDETITHYMIRRRMEKASEYLLETDKKVKEIATLVGYRDSSYFIRMFKKHTGKTPAEFKGRKLY